MVVYLHTCESKEERVPVVNKTESQKLIYRSGLKNEIIVLKKKRSIKVT